MESFEESRASITIPPIIPNISDQGGEGMQC